MIYLVCFTFLWRTGLVLPPFVLVCLIVSVIVIFYCVYGYKSYLLPHIARAGVVPLLMFLSVHVFDLLTIMCAMYSIHRSGRVLRFSQLHELNLKIRSFYETNYPDLLPGFPAFPTRSLRFFSFLFLALALSRRSVLGSLLYVVLGCFPTTEHSNLLKNVAKN